MPFLVAVTVSPAVLAAPTPRPFRDPGHPLPAPELPAGLEVAPWAPLFIDACRDKLLATDHDGHEFRFATFAPVRIRRDRYHAEPIYCHVPQPAVLYRSRTGIQYSGYTYLSCAMTLAMTRMEQILQEEARRIFERPDTENPVYAISHFGTYNCRRLRHKLKQSQHSFGNAIDLAVFAIRGVGAISVARHWTARWPALQKASDFLHAVARRLRDEAVFTNVLDPDYDGGHWNHIHVDMAPLSDGAPSPALALTRAMPPNELPNAPAPPSESPATPAADLTPTDAPRPTSFTPLAPPPAASTTPASPPDLPRPDRSGPGDSQAPAPDKASDTTGRPLSLQPPLPVQRFFR